MGLDRDITHTWVVSDKDGFELECDDCNMPWARRYPGDEPPEKYCSGLKQTPLKKVSSKKKKNRTDSKGRKHTYGPYWKWVSKTQPCVVCGKVDGAPADHLKTVGSGGKDKANCIPVCADHQDRHDLGIETWADKYGFTKLELQEIALELWGEYDGLPDN